MKLYRNLLLLLVAFLCGSTAMAQKPELPQPTNQRPVMTGPQNSGGQGGPRIVYKHFNPSLGQWDVEAYDTVCDVYYPNDWIGTSNKTASGTYTLHYVTEEDYDSIVTLHLTVKTSTTNLLPMESACDSYTWAVNGVTYTTTQDINYCLPDIHNVQGCDSILILRLTINTSSDSVFTETRCDSYKWPVNRVIYDATGTYTFTRGNAVGCDSNCTLNLTIHYSTSNTDVQNVCDRYTWEGDTYTSSTNVTKPLHTIYGCDSTVTLNLTIRNSTHDRYSANECDTYTWNNHGNTITKTTTGVYTSNYTNAVNCPSTDTLHLTIRNSSHDAFTEARCDSYTWNNHGANITKTASGVYTHNYNNAQNCPSTDTLHLTIGHTNSYTDVHDECDSYTWHGNTYTSSNNTAQWTGTNHENCDSVVTLNLTIRKSSTSTDVQYGCYSFDWHGHHYTSSNYTDMWHGTNAVGCDSVVTLNLTIRSYSTDTTTVTACDSYTWNGTTYTATTNDTRTMPNHFGCDSIDVLHLTIHHSNAGIDPQIHCDSYTWHGVTYTASTNTPTFTETNVANCDSVVTLHLTIHHSDLSGVETVNVCDSYTWHGTTYTQSSNSHTYNTITTHGCDSMATLHLTIRKSTHSYFTDNVCDSYIWHGTTYTTSGSNYTYTHSNANEVNCDSTEHLNLTVRHSTVSNDNKSVCDSFSWAITGLTYYSTQHLEGHIPNSVGCDSTLNINLTVRHSTTDTVNAHGCDTYTWHGRTYNDNAEDDWHTTNHAGCDSVAHLHLVMDATLHYHDTVHGCEQYTWHGNTYSFDNNTATDSTISVAGCDSINHLHLTIHHHDFYYPTQDACDSYTWIDTTFYVTGMAYRKLVDMWGCDSNVTLSVRIYHSDSNTVNNINTCDTYTWPTNHQTYTSTIMNVRDTLRTSHQCDSICTLNLTIRHSTASTDVRDVCDSLTWLNGVTYFAPPAATTTHTINNAVECDSVITLNLTVRHSTSSSISPDVCDQYTWESTGETYFQTLDTTIRRTNAVGCDSLLTMNLIVRHRTSEIVDKDVCDSYTWHGNTYTASTNTPTFDTVNAAGCDSTANLHLVIRYRSEGIDTHDECDQFVWHSTTYTASTTSPTFYMPNGNAVGCDSTAHLHLTIRYSSIRNDNVDSCDRYRWVDGTVYTASNNTATYGVGLNAVGCDSTAHLHLIIRNSNAVTYIDTACDSYTWLGNTYTTSTVVPTTFPNANAVGCDSTITLQLTVDYTKTYTDVHDVCDTFTWTNGVTYTASTTSPLQNLYTVVGHCDSTTHLDLTVRYSSSYNDVNSVCDSFLWTLNNIKYFQSNNTDTVHRINSVLCDSLITLNLTVRHSGTFTDYHDVCDSLVWHGTTYTTDNDTSQWIGLNLDNCDSTVTLNLHVRYSTTGTDYKDICDSITWLDGIRYTADDTIAQAHILNLANCDSLVTLHLHVRYNSNTAYSDTACDSYTWNNRGWNNTYTATGDYRHNYTSVQNCPSTDTLHLVVNYSDFIQHNDTACDSYTWPLSAITYTVSSDDTVHYLNRFQCDSTHALHLVMFYNSDTAYYADVCNQYVWNNNDSIHTYTTSGTFLNSYLNAVYCPSVDTLYLTVRYSSDSLYIDTACEQYTWMVRDTNFTYTLSGEYLYDYTSVQNCPSTDTLRLQLYYNTSSTLDTTVCEQFLWSRDSVIYDSTGHYGVNYLTVHNCPSTDSLFLTIHHRLDSTWIDSSCDVYTWQRNRMTYADSGYHVYTYGPYQVTTNVCWNTDTLKLTLFKSDHGGMEDMTGCDSVIWHDATYFTSGTYSFSDLQTIHGCDSTATLHLTLHYKSDTIYVVEHACDYYIWNRDSINLYYDTSGLYLHNYQNQWGCWSLDKLDLMVYYKSDTTYIDTACDNYTWKPVGDPTLWSRSYIADTATSLLVADTHSYNNRVNCPSVDTLRLILYESPRGDEHYVVCDSLFWRDSTTYRTDTDTTTCTGPSPVWCDSIITLHLHVNYSIHIDSTDYFCEDTTYIFHDSTIYTTGVYFYGDTTTAGCDSTILLNLQRLPIPVYEIEESHSCETYEYTLSVNVLNDSFGLPYTYTWESDPNDLTLYGQEHDTLVIVHPVQNTLYSLSTAYDVLPTCGNVVSTDTLLPIVQPHSEIKTTPPFVEQHNVSFKAEDVGYDYTDRYWYVNGQPYGSDKTIAYQALPSDSSNVNLMLVNTTATCADTAYLQVPIHNFSLYIPNIFTPTEPTNKVFRVTGKSVGDFEMWIYTREGLLVYHSTDITEGWDGRHNGELCHQAAYVYHVRYTTVVASEAWHTVTGTVMLVR